LAIFRTELTVQFPVRSLRMGPLVWFSSMHDPVLFAFPSTTFANKS
jgi:hypothetical protein